MIKIFKRKPTPSAITSVGEMIVNLTKMVADLGGMVVNSSKSHSAGLKGLGDLIASQVMQERQSISILARTEARMVGIERQMTALAEEQARLSNLVENAFSISLGGNTRLNDIKSVSSLTERNGDEP